MGMVKMEKILAELDKVNREHAKKQLNGLNFKEEYISSNENLESVTNKEADLSLDVQIKCLKNYFDELMTGVRQIEPFKKKKFQPLEVDRKLDFRNLEKKPSIKLVRRTLSNSVKNQIRKVTKDDSIQNVSGNKSEKNKSVY